jgi:hypothetical protein
MMGSGVRVPSAAPSFSRSQMFGSVARETCSGWSNCTNNPFDTAEYLLKGREVLSGNTWHDLFCEVNLVTNEAGEAFRARLKYPDCKGQKKIEKTERSGKMKVRSGMPRLQDSPLGSGSVAGSSPLPSKNLNQQALQDLLDGGNIRSVEDLVAYVASRGWLLKRISMLAPDGRHMIGIRTAPCQIFRVRTEFDPSSANLPRSKHSSRA